MRTLKLSVLILLSLLILGISSYAATEFKTVFQPRSDLPITVFNLTFRVGSADDPKGGEGFANLAARMLREGGVKAWSGLPARSRAEIEEFLFPLGAEIRVQVDKEQTSFRVTCASNESVTVFKILAQMILAPAFDASEFDRIRLEELDAVEKRAPREDQEELGKAALDQQIYGKEHPYSHLVQGSIEDLEKAQLEKVKAFYKTHYTQKRLTIGIAGVLKKNLRELTKKYFSKLPKGKSARAVLPTPKPVERPKLLIVKGPFESTGIHLGSYHSLNRKNPEFDLLYLTAITFGKHRSFVGRLMKVVREVRGLNYGTYSYAENFPLGGYRLLEPTQAARSQQAFTVWARPTTLENGCFLLRQVYREVENLAKNGFEKAQFELGKSHLIGNAPLLATGPERQLGYAIDDSFYGVPGGYLTRLQNSAKKASKTAVSKVIKKYIDPSKLHIVVVTPDPDQFKKEIFSESCPIHYAPGITKPESVLAEDKLISAYKLPLKPEDVSTVQSEDLFAK